MAPKGSVAAALTTAPKSKGGGKGKNIDVKGNSSDKGKGNGKGETVKGGKGKGKAQDGKAQGKGKKGPKGGCYSCGATTTIATARIREKGPQVVRRSRLAP